MGRSLGGLSRSLAVGACVLVATGVVSTADAALLVTYNFTGFVTNASGASDGTLLKLNNTILPGPSSVATGSFTYDTATVGVKVPGFTNYGYAIKSFSLTIQSGSYSLGFNPTQVSMIEADINMNNNVTTGDFPDYFAGRVGQMPASDLTLPPGATFDQSAEFVAGINLGGPDTLFNDESLPPTLDFSKFTWHAIRLFPQLQGQSPNPNDGFIRVELTSLTLNQVPEPGTVALLGIGLAGLAASRRRKQ